MKVAVLFDTKFGNTKELAEFLAEQLSSSGHDAKTFQTKTSEPADLLAFEPEAILVGAPTHAWRPARAIGRYLKKIGKLIKKGSQVDVKKAAAFNCNIGVNVCHRIEKKISEAFPNIVIYENSLPMKVGGFQGPLPEDWKAQATPFIQGVIQFLS